MNKIRIAIIGAGDISEKYIMQAKKLKDAAVIAVCSKHIKNAEKKAKKFKIPAFYDNHIKLLKKEKPDAVVVCSPHSLHAKHTIDAMRYGAHVLAEKPFATNFKDALEMVKVSKKYKKILMALPFDQYPYFLRAFSFIKEKYIGKITSAHSEYCSGPPVNKTWFFDKKIAGVGVLCDLGVYAVSRLISILGGAKKVIAFSNILTKKRIGPNNKKIFPTVDDNNVLLLEFSGGIFATVKASWCHPFVENYTIIYGRNGAIYLDASRKILLVKSKTKIKGKRISFRGQNDWHMPDIPKLKSENDIIGTFVKAIKTGKNPIYNAMQATHITEILLKAYSSAKNGKVMKIKTPFKMWWNKEKEIQNLKKNYL